MLLHKKNIGHPAKAPNLKITKLGFHPLYETCVPREGDSLSRRLLRGADGAGAAAARLRRRRAARRRGQVVQGAEAEPHGVSSERRGINPESRRELAKYCGCIFLKVEMKINKRACNILPGRVEMERSK